MLDHSGTNGSDEGMSFTLNGLILQGGRLKKEEGEERQPGRDINGEIERKRCNIKQIDFKIRHTTAGYKSWKKKHTKANCCHLSCL